MSEPDSNVLIDEIPNDLQSRNISISSRVHISAMGSSVNKIRDHSLIIRVVESQCVPWIDVSVRHNDVGSSVVESLSILVVSVVDELVNHAPVVSVVEDVLTELDVHAGSKKMID